ITGSWGDQIGSRLWRVLGVGSVLLPVLGIGWALAAFERLGSLSAGRAAALGAGLIVLLPYGIGTVTGAGFPPVYAAWGPTQQLVGLVPAVLAHGVHQAVGTAGGTLVGLFALSALGILTVGWHPLVALRTRETGIGKRDAGSGMRDAQKPGKPAKPERAVEAEEQARERTVAALKAAKARAKPTPPASRIPHLVPAGVLIPPIDLLHPAPPEDGDAGLAQIEQMGQKLIETLQTFRVEGSIAGRTVGPVVTQYEVAPGPGVKVGRIAALAHRGLPAEANRHKAASGLKWAVGEMVRRNRRLQAKHARNIGDFNNKVEEKRPLKGPRGTLATQAGIQKELPLAGEYTGG